MSMHIKKGDAVLVLSGADKKKKGTVLQVFPGKNMVLVEGVNMKKKHQKARQQNRKGQVVDIPHPIHASNVRASDAPAKKTVAKKK